MKLELLPNSERHVINDARCMLGEGPVWSALENALYWVDIKGSSVHRYSLATEQSNQWSVPSPIGALALTQDPAVKLGSFTDGLYKLTGWSSAELQRALLLQAEPGQSRNRHNDGKVDSEGRFWFGTMDDSETEQTGALYSYANGQLHKHDTGYCITNGPAFSPDGSTLYHTDTLQRVIYAFDHHQGQLSNKRVFIRIAPDAGYPDGLGHRITRFDQLGREIGAVRMPVPNVTSCTFGGKDLSTLYITTARKGLSKELLAQYPLSGACFAINTPFQGQPTGLMPAF
jgi:xylono-1,5-lactonase